MSKDAVFSARIDSQIKDQGDAILNDLGIKPSQALSIFYHQIIFHRGLPFDLKLPQTPNADLQAAIEDAQNPEKLSHYPDTQTLFNDVLNEN